jgi:hypothetical protein
MTTLPETTKPLPEMIEDFAECLEARQAARRVLDDEASFATLRGAILDAPVRSLADALAKLQFAFAYTFRPGLAFEQQPPAVRAIADAVDFLEALEAKETAPRKKGKPRRKPHKLRGPKGGAT